MLRRYCSLIVQCSCFLDRGVVRPRWQILYKLMWNGKEVSDGDHSQQTFEVGVSGDYTFIVGKAVVGSYGCLIVGVG